MMNLAKIRIILNILFMTLALAAVIAYFVVKENYILFTYLCGAAICVKMIESCLRFIRKK